MMLWLILMQDMSGDGMLKHNFGMELKAHRMSRGYGSGRFARILKMDNRNYAKLEQGRRSPPENPEKVIKLIAPLRLGSHTKQVLIRKAYWWYLEKLMKKWKIR